MQLVKLLSNDLSDQIEPIRLSKTPPGKLHVAQVLCRSYTVSGKVQGVFFRASTARQATRLNLTGWAKNLPDGNVEILARGELDHLADLEQWLGIGPPMARVDSVATRSENAEEFRHLEDFRTG